MLITYAANTSDYDELSASLRDKFRQKGLGFQKFRLWDQDYISAVRKGSQFRLYWQDKLNYAILVEYLPVESNLYAVAAIVPDTKDFIGIINRLSLLLHAAFLVIAVIFLYLLVKHITNPLRRMEDFARDITRQKYGFLEVSTRDELEHVADSMNQMSRSIQQYQNMLETKNRQMEQLLNDVAHDLKTPISLIGMYSSGIQDGLDDGTFLETIIQQNARMSQMTERLLNLAGIGQKDYPMTTIFLDQLLIKCVSEQEILFSRRSLTLRTAITHNLVVMGNEELITELLTNLLSNAAKYASASPIEVKLCETDGRCCLRISNEFSNESLDTERIWEPFYVGEPSRNKAMSGTGLGLAIVKKDCPTVRLWRPVCTGRFHHYI